MNKMLMMVFVVLVVSACTNKDLYNSIQPNKSDCRKLAMHQQEDCNKRVDEQLPYEDYKKQRESL